MGCIAEEHRKSEDNSTRSKKDTPYFLTPKKTARGKLLKWPYAEVWVGETWGRGEREPINTIQSFIDSFMCQALKKF